MGTPTFSVVIPAYEAASFIRGAIRSVLDQTAAPLEIIVVDDGSTDALTDALVEFEDDVRPLRIEHGGEAAARNRGIREARGQFVAFLDADDAYEPSFLEALTALAIQRPDLDILTTDCFFEVDGQRQGSFYRSNSFPVTDQRSAILERCFLTTQSAVRRSCLEEIGGFDESIVLASDWDMWLRLILRGARAGLVNEPLATYRLGRPGQMTERRAAALKWRVVVLEKALRSPELTGPERETVARALPLVLRRAVLTAAIEAGRRGRQARRAWFAIGRERRLTSRTRLWGMVGTVSPAAAQRIARRRVQG